MSTNQPEQESRPPRICVVGSVNMDLVVRSPRIPITRTTTQKSRAYTIMAMSVVTSSTEPPAAGVLTRPANGAVNIAERL